MCITVGSLLFRGEANGENYTIAMEDADDKAGVSATNTRGDELLAKFRGATMSEPESLWPDAQQVFVARLSKEERLHLAEALAASKKSDELWLAVSIDLEFHFDDRAAAGVANLAKLGPVDFGRFSWSAMHGGREDFDLLRVVRLYVAASTLLLPQIESLPGESRLNAISFVSDAGFNPKLDHFSLPLARERLDKLSRSASSTPIHQ